MRNRKKILLVILSIFFYYELYSMPVDTTSIIDNIYNYDFLRASEKLSQHYEKDALISETLNLEIKWWMALEKGDRDHKEHFSEFLVALNQFEKASGNDISVIISSTYRMRYYACTNKIFMLPFLFMKIQNRINKVDITGTDIFEKDRCELFILYKAFLTLVRNSYVPDMLLSDSDRKQDLISDIEGVISNGSSPNRTIGRYFLMKYYLDVKKDKPKAFGYLNELHNSYPNNLVFTQLLIN